MNVVTPGYFKVMGIDILRGLAFTVADDEHGRRVAIVSESTAKKFWPGQDAWAAPSTCLAGKTAILK